jgi:hypothetical protein
MTGRPLWFSACRGVLVVLVASYATLASNVAGHALLDTTSRVLDDGARVALTLVDLGTGGTSPVPAQTPIHDENNCLFCQGSGSLILRPTHVDATVHLAPAPAPGPNRIAAPRTREANPELARAPPHDLFS